VSLLFSELTWPSGCAEQSNSLFLSLTQKPKKQMNNKKQPPLQKQNKNQPTTKKTFHQGSRWFSRRGWPETRVRKLVVSSAA